ncbi:MAG TPA: hypothetical protein RMH99_19810 [Sandaracinaceae bacterium LLY-WYZ-13_1]|nr:hypothetical protein [Sandaracinaceae bacterium LLY-WYZ-13_1]
MRSNPRPPFGGPASFAILGAVALSAQLDVGCALFRQRGGETTDAAPTEETRELTLSADSEAMSLEGAAGGDRRARDVDDGCVGYIGEAPNFVIRVEDEIPVVQIEASSSEDTALVVQTPDGTYVCDDDSAGSQNPRVESPFPPGDYQVYVATYRRNDRGASYTLSVATATRPSGPFTGDAVLENRTSTPICRIEYGGQGSHAADLNVAPGESGTFSVPEELNKVWIFGCDGSVLFGSPNRSLTSAGTYVIGTLEAGGIVLLEAGSEPEEIEDRLVLVADPMSMDDYLDGMIDALVRTHADDMNGRGMRSQAFEALQEGGRANRWVETFVALRMASSDWNIVRHRHTGAPLRRVATGVAVARFPDGHCQATPVSFVQEHDGSGFSRNLRFGDIGGNHYVPCAAADAAASHRDWAH